MAKHLFEQPDITLNGYTVGGDVMSAELVTGRRAPVDVTGLSDTYDNFLVPNLRNWAVRLNYFNNFTGTSAGTSGTGITNVLKTIYDSSATSGVTLTIRMTTGNRGVSNNEWSGQVQIDGEFQPWAGGLAEADKGSVSLKGLGTLTWLGTTT